MDRAQLKFLPRARSKACLTITSTFFFIITNVRFRHRIQDRRCARVDLFELDVPSLPLRMFGVRHVRVEPFLFELVAVAYAFFPNCVESLLSLDYGLMVQSIMDAFDY
jgi:hypothetical protein